MSRYEVRILNKNLEWVAIADTFRSVSWKRRWQKNGEFQLVINRHMDAAKYLAKGHYLVVYRDGQHEMSGIIRQVSRKIDENGKISEDLEVIGNTLDGLLARRICIPPAGVDYDERTGPAETIMKGYVDTNVINPSDPNRKIPGFVNAPDLGRGTQTSQRMRYNPLPEAVALCGQAGGLGWEVQLVNRQFVFDVIPGVDRSASQNLIAPIIFDPAYDNIQLMGWEDTDIGRFNVGYVAGQGEGAARTIVEVADGAPAGLDRIEYFVDARDLSTTEQLQERGKAKLAEQGEEEKLEASILPVPGYLYRTDWDIGDLVTLRNRDWGIKLDKRIMEVHVALEEAGETVSVSFGAVNDGFLDAIKSELANMGPILRG